ncbi:MAG: hypothetical protein ABIE74_11995 [Pseudomonadota bacterium]
MGLDSSYTKQERHIIVLLRIWGTIFLGLGLMLLFFPNFTIEYIAGVGHSIFGWTDTPLEISGTPIWMLMTIVSLFTLAYISFIAQGNRLRNLGMIKSLILYAFLACLASLVCLLKDIKFIYLTALVTSGLIFISTTYYYNAAKRSR